MRIKEWRGEIGKYFPDFVLPAEVGVSVICQLLIKDITNPFGLVYVDVPSSGKTMVLNLFSGLKDLAYTTDNFSSAAFVSHASNVKKKDLEKIDLLPKIRRKTLIIRDLAPIFGMRDEDLLKTMGLLTRVFDGEGLQTDSGVHGQRGYEGDYLFMMLAASTPIPPRVFKVMGNFGSRLFFINVNSRDKSCSDLAGQISGDMSTREKEVECREATKQFMKFIWSGSDGVVWNPKKEERSLLEEIAGISSLVASLRGSINVWKDLSSGESFNHTVPQIEKPDRINQAFYNLARGHAVACGRNAINDEDVAIVLRVALSSASLERTRLFKLLIDSGGTLGTEEVIHGVRCSRPTALKLMEQFELLKIVEGTEFPKDWPVGRSEKTVVITEQFSWFIGDRFGHLNAWHTGAD